MRVVRYEGVSITGQTSDVEAKQMELEGQGYYVIDESPTSPRGDCLSVEMRCWEGIDDDGK